MSEGQAIRRQERTLSAYTALRLLREDWGGRLLLCVGLNDEGRAVSLAANMAGAVCLSIDPEPQRIKAALHEGVCDFAVTTLDEALRTLKNEVRRRQPLTVCLQSDTKAALRELLKRGIDPELVSLGSEAGGLSLLQSFQRQGSEILCWGTCPGREKSWSNADERVRAEVEARGWQERVFQFSSPAELREFDRVAASMLPPEDLLRVGWLRTASRILKRQRPFYRLLWLTPEEALALGARFENMVL